MVVILDLDFEIDRAGGSELELKANNPNPHESNGSDWRDCYAPRVRPSEANGFVVYTRNKWLKRRNEGVIGFWDKPQSDSVSITEAVKVESSHGGVVVHGGNAANVGGFEGNFGTPGLRDGVGESDGEMMELEMKEDARAAGVAEINGPSELTRSVLRSKDEDSETENGSSGDLQDSVVLVAGELESEKLAVSGKTRTRTMETEMSKEILIEGRPTTVTELLETGLLEGYSVFYNGGNRV